MDRCGHCWSAVGDFILFASIVGHFQSASIATFDVYFVDVFSVSTIGSLFSVTFFFSGFAID